MKPVIYRLTANTAFEFFSDGGLILHLESAAFTELNASARDIVHATDGCTSQEQVAALIAKEYEIDPTWALRDVTKLYQQLQEQGLVEPVQ